MNKEEKLELLHACDSVIDSEVKIVGTNYDRRRKVTKGICTKMTKMVSTGKSVKKIADKFGLTSYAVNYNTDPDFKMAEKIRKMAYKAVNKTSSDLSERADYKRYLVASGKNLTPWVK